MESDQNVSVFDKKISNSSAYLIIGFVSIFALILINYQFNSLDSEMSAAQDSYLKALAMEQKTINQ